MSSSNGNNNNSNKPVQVDSEQTNQLVLPDKKSIISEDNLLKALMADDNTFELLDIVIAELAEEGASLKYERIKKEFEDEPTDRISLRRANILKMVNDALIQKRNLALNDFINLRSPQWQVVFGELMDRIRLTFDDLGYSSEQMELFFENLQNRLENFEEDTEMILKENASKA